MTRNAGERARAIPSGTSAGSGRPPRRSVTQATRKTPGMARSANQASPFQMWLRATWPSSWAATDSSSACAEAAVEDGVVEDDPFRRPDARHVRVGRGRPLARVRDENLVHVDPLLVLRAPRSRAASCLSASGSKRVEERLDDERLREDVENARERRSAARPRATTSGRASRRGRACRRLRRQGARARSRAATSWSRSQPASPCSERP